MSTKCVNCVQPAEYRLADPGVNPLDYCGECLPQSFRLRAAEGSLPLPPEVEVPVEMVTELELAPFVEPASDEKVSRRTKIK